MSGLIACIRVVAAAAALGAIMASGAGAAEELRASLFSWSADQTPDQWRPRLQRLKAAGCNSIVLMGDHLRFDDVDRWPVIKSACGNRATSRPERTTTDATFHR